MDGMNKKFKANPVDFLKKHLLSVEPLENLGKGDLNLDLVADGLNAKLQSFKRAKPDAAHAAKHQLPAYWLPWQSGGVAEMTLGDKANYFFTSKMDGCQLRVLTLGGGGVKVLHIAGDAGGSDFADDGDEDNVGGSNWREGKAQSKLGAQGYIRSRALSSTANQGNQVYGGKSVHVVGFKKDGAWQFWVQESLANVYQFQTGG